MIALLLFAVSPIAVKANYLFDQSNAVQVKVKQTQSIVLDSAYVFEQQTPCVLPYNDIGLQDLSNSYISNSQTKNEVFYSKTSPKINLHIDPGWCSLNVTKQ